MSSYVAPVGKLYSNNDVYRYGLNAEQYEAQQHRTSDLQPRVKTYGGWASYKNSKSGQYNREICSQCAQMQGFDQSPGVYPIEYDHSREPPEFGLYRNQKRQNNRDYETYQCRRMSIHPGNVFSNYNNYFNNQCGNIYPKRYVNHTYENQVAENILPYTLRDSINPA